MIAPDISFARQSLAGSEYSENMTVDELLESVAQDSAPSSELSQEVQVLWHTKADNWDTAHNIAQEIHTPTGSWLHALLHLIEGDTGNAAYWFRKAGKRIRSTGDIDALWHEIATELLE
ncbi:MAG: hypothetical protein R3C59_18030 [Planctomycetaceae bacterium]